MSSLPSVSEWSRFPIRGSLYAKPADVGTMEIFGQRVVAGALFRVADALRSGRLS